MRELIKTKCIRHFIFTRNIHEEEDYIFHLKPKIRKDSQDPKRNLLDLQEFYLLHIGDYREIKFGISKEFGSNRNNSSS